MNLIKPDKHDLIIPQDIPVNLVGGQYYYPNFVKCSIQFT